MAPKSNQVVRIKSEAHPLKDSERVLERAFPSKFKQFHVAEDLRIRVASSEEPRTT